MKKKGGDLICMRPDSIVEARFKLTKKQNDIMDMVFASIEDDGNLEYDIDIKKYAKLYNVKDTSDIYGELKKAVRTFEGKGFAITNKISEKKENRIYFSWFSSIEYLDGEGKIKFELGHKLKTLLLEVKRATFYNIQYSINFNSIYSKRLYYYLKLFEDKKSRIDNIDTLREKLECPLGYKNYADFNRYVLKPAYGEINGNSDISFEYTPQKTGKKVTHIKFDIKSNKVNAPKEKIPINEVSADIDDNISKIVELMKDHKITYSEAKSIYKSNSNLMYIAEIYEHFKNKPAENFVGLMVEQVKPGVFNKPKQSQNGTSFNNFEPREYDYNSLERKLLGWEDGE